MSRATDTPLIPRQTFFENPAALNPVLSPDGRWFSWLAAVDGVMNVWVAPRDDLEAKRAITRQTGRPIMQHWFARTNAHVLYRCDTNGDENYHIWCVAIDGSGAPRDLTPYAGTMAYGVGLHRADPSLAAIAMNDRDASWHDLYAVDIRTGSRSLIYENRDEIDGFTLDDRLGLRLATTTRGMGTATALLKWNGTSFERLLTIPADDSRTTNPLAFNRAGDAWFLRSSVDHDRSAIYRVDWTTDRQTLIAAHNKADVVGWLICAETGEMIAASAEYLKPEWIAVDAEAGRDLARLEQELDGTIEVCSQSDDDRLWIVAGNRPDRPVSWHLFDRDSGVISKLFVARPKLQVARLAPMHPVVVKARDGLELVCYLTLPADEAGARPTKPLAMVLEVHGGPWARDGWGYRRDVQWYANRGWAVLQVNFRASTGFGKAFVNAGNREWAGKMHDDLIDAVEWAIAEGIADRRRIAICGRSYGGFASFVGATFTPEVFCCSVPVVGITNLETLQASIPPYWASLVEQMADRVGDPRTEEGRALLHARSPLHRAGNILKPMLIGHGANDVRCKVAEADRIVAAMTESGIPVTYVVFPDEGHGFHRPENGIAFFAMMEAFLAHHLGGRAEPVGGDFKGSNHEIRAGADILVGLGVPVGQS